MPFELHSESPPGLHTLHPKEWGLLNYADFDMDVALKQMHNCWPIIASLVAGYLTMVFFVAPLRHPYGPLLKNVRQAWNTGLAVFSMIGSLHVMTHLAHSIATRGLYSHITQHDNSFFVGPTGFWLLLFVLGKIVELGDTVLLLLSGRNLSFLHWFHHSSVLAWCWYELQAKTPMHHTCMSLNFTVHTFMYGYFALNDTFDDPSFRRRWGMRITAMQCTQFVLDLTVISIGWYDRFVDDASHISVTSLCLSSCIISTYLFLFLKFAEEKYGVYSQIRHALWRRSSQHASKGCAMPWHRTDISLDQRFEEAAKMAVMLSYVATPHDLLTLYGAFKRARSGPMPALMKEPSDDDRARAKWHAWNQASNRTKEEAQLVYIDMLDTLSERSIKAQEMQSKAQQTLAPLNNDLQPANPFVLYPVKIAGHGAYHPKRIVLNDEIEMRGGLTLSTQERKRTGVIERRWADIDGGENIVQNGAVAPALMLVSVSKSSISLLEALEDISFFQTMLAWFSENSDSVKVAFERLQYMPLVFPLLLPWRLPDR
jgi:elongation of very long chain fatty acids protein 6